MSLVEISVATAYTIPRVIQNTQTIQTRQTHRTQTINIQHQDSSSFPRFGSFSFFFLYVSVSLCFFLLLLLLLGFVSCVWLVFEDDSCKLDEHRFWHTGWY